LHELGIEILCANTPAAEGRVERAPATLREQVHCCISHDANVRNRVAPMNHANVMDGGRTSMDVFIQ
jgi:hypothetical protein